jgi:exosortase/archaeosortase family protein
MFLRANWRKVCLCLLTVPVVIFKNAVRIVAISWLGLYVTRDFFQGRLHHQYGGLVFSLLSLGMQLSMLFVLQRSEGDPHGWGMQTAAGWLKSMHRNFPYISRKQIPL